jgi:hypothetical protein
MIASIGAGSADLQEIFRAFRDGSECDPCVTGALGDKYTCHPNGWGYALYDGKNLHHYRSNLPVWKDGTSLPKVSGERTYAIFHSRLASDPNLDAPICSHPFIATTGKEVILFAHNGGIQEDVSLPNVVDSEWGLAQVVKAGSVESALPKLKQCTKPNSALNLVILAIPRDKAKRPVLHCLNFHKSENPGRIAYYNMHTGNLGSGKLFFSSTFTKIKQPIAGLANVQAAPFGELFDLAD